MRICSLTDTNNFVLAAYGETGMSLWNVLTWRQSADRGQAVQGASQRAQIYLTYDFSNQGDFLNGNIIII